jgi:hypothetical protein
MSGGAATFTGWNRADWVGLLARLTDGFVRSIPIGGSPARAQLPGAPPDDPVPSIEGFARMSVAWAAWLHEPSNPGTLVHRGRRHDVARLVARGLTDATDPGHPAYWGPIGDRDQRIVEAAEIATAWWLGGERLQTALRDVDQRAPGRVLDWLEQVDGRGVWPDNWVLFPVMPALVRRAAGRPIDEQALDAALDWMDRHVAGDGWYRDGAGHALDLYSGWAIHWHLLWWAAVDGSRRPARRAAVIRRAQTWLAGVAPLVAADGGFPWFGRSLGYRFALAAPFAQAALLGLDPLEPGVARRLASGVLCRSVAGGALDPATDWFRVGVGGEKPSVVEGYVSAGASAWAGHAFVALALAPDHAFWTAAEAPLASDGPASGMLASASAGILATWGGATGETRLLNARIGHPADIVDHDYAATYGKLAYRSAFPFDLPTDHAGRPGADGALVAVDPLGAVAHRNESTAGSAGPGWIVSRYRLPTTPAPTDVTTVILVVDRVEIRVSHVRSTGPVEIREAPATLGIDDRTAEFRLSEHDGCLAVADGGRTIAIRPLLGYRASGWGGTSATLANLVHDRSCHPYVAEGRPTSGPRLLAAAILAVAADVDPVAALSGIAVTSVGPDAVEVRWAGGGAAVALGRRTPNRATVAGITARGPRLRVLRVADGGRAIAGESIASIDGVARFDRPGAVGITRTDDAIDVTTTAGFTLDPAWAGRDAVTLLTRRGAGPWHTIESLEEPGVVPDALVRRVARRHGTRLVDLRLERRA